MAYQNLILPRSRQLIEEGSRTWINYVELGQTRVEGPVIKKHVNLVLSRNQEHVCCLLQLVQLYWRNSLWQPHNVVHKNIIA